MKAAIFGLQKWHLAERGTRKQFRRTIKPHQFFLELNAFFQQYKLHFVVVIAGGKST
jgi:hypothetical protein